MTFKNKLAAVAVVSGLFLTGMANMAVAQAINANMAQPATYSGNIVVPRGGVDLDNTSNVLDVTIAVPGAADFIPEDDDTFQINLTLSNGAVFSGNIVVDVGTMEDDDSHTADNADGTDGALPGRRLRNQAFFQGTIPATTGEGMDVLLFTIQPDAIRVQNSGPVQMSLLGEVSFDDGSFTDVVLFRTTISYIEFAPDTLSISAEQGEPSEMIDVAQNSRLFTGGTPRTADAGITVSVAPHLKIDGTAVSLDDIVDTADITLEADNGLSAFQKTGDYEESTDNPGRSITYGATELVVSEDSQEAGAAEVMPSALGPQVMVMAGMPAMPTGVLTHSQILTLEVPTSNQRRIDATSLALEIDIDAEQGYSDETLEVTLNPLTKTGSRDVITFALGPAAAYPMFIRVTNPGSIAGPVSVVLINDDGEESDSIALGDIRGAASNNLAGGASTGLLSIDDVFEAAGSDFELGRDSSRLRVEVEAEFGVTGTPTGVVLNAFSQSDDGNTFFMLTNARGISE